MPEVKKNVSMGELGPVQAAIPAKEQLPTKLTVRISSLRTEGPTLATASICLNGVFAVRGVKVIRGDNGPFIAMPSYRTVDGFRDICFPCTKEFREQLHTAVLNAYRQELAQLAHREQMPPSQEPPAPELTM